MLDSKLCLQMWVRAVSGSHLISPHKVDSAHGDMRVHLCEIVLCCAAVLSRIMLKKWLKDTLSGISIILVRNYSLEIRI